MKIAHTADWHLGKIVNGFSMIEDQEYALFDLIEKLKSYDLDVMIMAGDLYDRANPPKEAISLANRLFNKILTDLNVPLLLIAGNHDSPDRIEYAKEFFALNNFYMEGTLKSKTKKVSIKDTDFWLLPYSDYVHGRSILDESEIHSFEDLAKIQLERIYKEMDESRLNVIIYHGFVIHQSSDSIEESDSERPLSMGNAEYVSASLFDGFDYVALGHLHKAQQVKSERIRYSGSPLKYSKSEANHNKVCAIIDLEKDSISYESIAIKPLRNLKIIKGQLDDLLREKSTDYVFVELLDENYQLHAMQKLRQVYPYIMGLEYVNRHENQLPHQRFNKQSLKKRSLAELFQDFYKEARGQDLSRKQKQLVHQLAQQVKENHES